MLTFIGKLVTSWQKIAAFIFGVVFIITLLVLAIAIPHPTPFQYIVFRMVLAISMAGVAAMIPGFINIQLNPRADIILRAGGAIAVFVITFFFSPAQLITEPPPLPFLITAPVNGANVELTETIRGETPHNQMNHYIVVTPSTGENWIQQGLVTISAGGSWTGFAKFGEATVGVREKFIVRCVATKFTLTAGPLKQEQMPLDAIFSESITVIRK